MAINVDDLTQQLLDAPGIPADLLAVPLPDDVARAVIERLKAEADRHWWINANRSLALADLIVQIGRARGDLSQTALGIMARGDALKFLGRLEEAWEALEQAGQDFLSAGDEIGWARTRIGRLLLSPDLNRVPEALADADAARAIFTRTGETEKILRLDLNTAIVYDLLGDYQRALALYQATLEQANALGEIGQGYRGALYTNIGYAYNYLGDFRQALGHYEQAYEIFAARGETSGAASARLNIAYIAQAQGHYQQALHLLHTVRHLADADLPLEAATAKQDMVECYLFLNRYAEACALAQEVIADYRALNAAYEMARTLLHLAVAEAELAHFDAAQAALNEAEPVFQSLGAAAWSAMVRLRRGQIALRQEDRALAHQEARAALDYFRSGGQQVHYALAVLLEGQALLAESCWTDAAQAAASVLRVAQHNNIPSLRYSAHLLAGRIEEGRGHARRAEQCYRAAAATVDRIQRGLTITLRPEFLEDKGDALRALIRLHVQDGRTAAAFEALERAKSQALLDYLSHREKLKWPRDDERAAALIEELNRLREEHQWFYQLAVEPREPDQGESALTPEQARAEASARERRMRAITEQLELHSAAEPRPVIAAPLSLDSIRAGLEAGALLVEFYNDGTHLWAFTCDSASLEVHPFPASVAAINQLIAQYQFNIACALKVGPAAPAASSLGTLHRQIAHRLHQALIEPLGTRLRGRDRLVIVPYGALHYLPFHLLHDGAGYLIEQHEIVVLPAAGLVTQRGPRQSGGARVLAHSRDGRLPQTLVEAERVHALLGGDVFREQQALRDALVSAPCRVLHIASHGEYRMDQPDLSYLQLADGQLYTYDLLQQDLSYELVTLSACETGRANVAAGDELIGLGRGFLYAGAGALIASLWQVNDDHTVMLMERLYEGLRRGMAKPAALRDAQCSLARGDPRLHPAFWGAFQFIGDAHPLSIPSDGEHKET